MIQSVSQDPRGINVQSLDGFVLSGAQVRAARALLRWSSEELAQRAKLGTATIKRAEAHDGPVTSTTANIQAMRNAFEKAGLEFIPENGGGAGVRFRERQKVV